MSRSAGRRRGRSGGGGQPGCLTCTARTCSTPRRVDDEFWDGPPQVAHAPMAMAHLGSGIWSQSFLTRGAIFFVSVPGTIIKSAGRGEERKTSLPTRAMSW